MKIIQLGAGLQGIATALDLARNSNFKTVMLADYNMERANEVAELCNKKYGENFFRYWD